MHGAVGQGRLERLPRDGFERPLPVDSGGIAGSASTAPDS